MIRIVSTLRVILAVIALVVAPIAFAGSIPEPTVLPKPRSRRRPST